MTAGQKYWFMYTLTSLCCPPTKEDKGQVGTLQYGAVLYGSFVLEGGLGFWSRAATTTRMTATRSGSSSWRNRSFRVQSWSDRISTCMLQRFNVQTKIQETCFVDIVVSPSNLQNLPSVPLVRDPAAIVGLSDEVPHGIERRLLRILLKQDTVGSKCRKRVRTVGLSNLVLAVLALQGT